MQKIGFRIWTNDDERIFRPVHGDVVKKNRWSKPLRTSWINDVAIDELLDESLNPRAGKEPL